MKTQIAFAFFGLLFVASVNSQPSPCSIIKEVSEGKSPFPLPDEAVECAKELLVAIETFNKDFKADKDEKTLNADLEKINTILAKATAETPPPIKDLGMKVEEKLKNGVTKEDAAAIYGITQSCTA
jgi:uncharacterized protein YpuA (DUF1002 family)